MRYRLMGFGVLAAAGLQQCQPACTPVDPAPAAVETPATVASTTAVPTTTQAPTTTAAPTTTTPIAAPTVTATIDCFGNLDGRVEIGGTAEVRVELWTGTSTNGDYLDLLFEDVVAGSATFDAAGLYPDSYFLLVGVGNEHRPYEVEDACDLPVAQVIGCWNSDEEDGVTWIATLPEGLGEWDSAEGAVFLMEPHPRGGHRQVAQAEFTITPPTNGNIPGTAGHWVVPFREDYRTDAYIQFLEGDETIYSQQLFIRSVDPNC